MVFKRLLGSLGVGGPTIDTVLDSGPVRPGEVLCGQVHVKGGSADFDIDHIAVELVACVEAEQEHGEAEGLMVFGRHVVGGGFRLVEAVEHAVPFQVTLPYETPVSELHGQPLGIALGVRAELSVKGARDKGDLDPLAIAPLPVQEAILENLGHLGFGFRSADLELGRIRGTAQQLPFRQELELAAPARYAHAVGEIEMTFLAGPGGMEVVLGADRRGGLPASGHDSLTLFTVSLEGVEQVDWNAEVDGWVKRLIERRASCEQGGGYRHAGRGRSGRAAAGAAGLAAGVAAGVVAAEVVDEVGDLFEGDEA
ncbi:sporulation protein [Streptomyces indicus]|uniref:Sporulation-control protein n=1 Tax=Streptomyces indicus TaxID=417292 RepID=A0A1G9JPD7_9ACTN|nr:sporulation protein [Streptomyces indicus]SDL38994.1 sporulation-control protein [Streptomyces indicus]